MRVLLILGVAVLFTLAFADHKESYDIEDHHDDHKKGEHKESLTCHKLALTHFRFSFKVYDQVARDHPSGNLVISPASISAALALMCHGAKDKSHSQIHEVMGFNMSEISEKEIAEGFHQYLDHMSDEDRHLQHSSGNALFISNKHKIHQPFSDEAKRLYHSDAFSTDFTNAEEAKNQINSYVEKNTHGKITKLKDSVDRDADSALINFMYYKGVFETPVDEKVTEGDFHVNENTIVKVPFMTITGWFRMACTDEACIISVPFKGNIKAVFLVTLPGKLPHLESTISIDLAHKWRRNLCTQYVKLSIPRFSFSTTIDLKETLSKMGLVDVFSDHPDLSAITEDANVKISQAVHRAVFSIDEKGSEAAASTAAKGVSFIEPAHIKLDHPFLLTMHDMKCGHLLCAARIVNP